MINRLAELRRNKQNGEDGFTLIELLVVVVILGILIAIAVPLYLNYQKSSNDKAAQSDVRNAVSVLETCNSDNGSYPTANFSVGSSTATGSAAAGSCDQKINTSNGTTVNYYVGTTSGAYLIVAKNANGNSANNYCYASSAGGSVSKTGAKTAYAAAC